MNVQRISTLVKMELKKIIREPAYLFLMILFPAVLALSFGLAFKNIPSQIPGVSQFSIMVPGLFTYACIFIIMTVAQAFADDREQGLLKRINTTPTTSGEFMGSHVISNSLLAILQVIIVAFFTFIMGFSSKGGLASYLLAFLFTSILSICSVGLGLITATISKSSSTATGLAFIFILPQMFFGTFIPINENTQFIAMFLPSYYVTDSLTKIFGGAQLTELIIWTNLLIVTIISIIIVLIGIELFKKYGKA